MVSEINLVDIFIYPVLHDQAAQVLIVASVIFMMLDVIFGAINASMKGQFSSSIMREGIGHKCSELAFIVVGIIIDAVISTGVTFPLNVDEPILKVICIGILIMELGSLMEIWAKMNPKLANLKIFKILASVKEQVMESEQESED